MKKIIAATFLSLSLLGFRQVENKAILCTGQSNARQMCPYIQSLLPDYLLVNVAVGGSSIQEWQEGGALFDNAVDQVLALKSQGYVFDGVFHYQGEANTQGNVESQEWGTLTRKFHHDLQIETGGVGEFIHIQLGQHPQDSPRLYWTRIQNKAPLICNNLPDCQMISIADVSPYIENSPHWPEAQKWIIAQRWVDAFLE